MRLKVRRKVKLKVHLEVRDEWIVVHDYASQSLIYQYQRSIKILLLVTASFGAI